MTDGGTLEALALSLATVAFPFRNWLVMLEVVVEQERLRRERQERERAQQNEIAAELAVRFGYVAPADAPQAGMAKPRTVEQSAAGAFMPGF